jgi:hypothetical protein
MVDSPFRSRVGGSGRVISLTAAGAVATKGVVVTLAILEPPPYRGQWKAKAG